MTQNSMGVFRLMTFAADVVHVAFFSSLFLLLGLSNFQSLQSLGFLHAGNADNVRDQWCTKVFGVLGNVAVNAGEANDNQYCTRAFWLYSQCYKQHQCL
jgi:hypothetical protein